MKRELSRELSLCKAGIASGLTENVCTQGPVNLTYVREFKGETLNSGTGTVAEFWRGYLTKERDVHISTQRILLAGTVP